MKFMKDYLLICNSAPSEILSIIALSNKERILQRNNKIVADNLKLFNQFFIEYSHLSEWVRHKADLFALCGIKAQTLLRLFVNN